MWFQIGHTINYQYKISFYFEIAFITIIFYYVYLKGAIGAHVDVREFVSLLLLCGCWRPKLCSQACAANAVHREPSQ